MAAAQGPHRSPDPADVSTKPQLQPGLPANPSEDTYCPRAPYGTAAFHHPSQNHQQKGLLSAPRLVRTAATPAGPGPSHALPELLSHAVFFQGQAGQVQVQLVFPLTLSTCFCPFLPAETNPKFLCGSEHQTTFWFPNQKWVKPKVLRDLVQASLCKSLPKLLWFAKQARNLLLSPFFFVSRNSLPSFFVPTDGYLRLTSCDLHCWNT